MAGSENQNVDRGETVRRKRSLVFEGLGSLMAFLILLVIALIFSIVAEWIGMYFFWPEQGALHSAKMLVTELGYLNQDFKQSAWGVAPIDIAVWLSSSVYYWIFEWTRIVDIIAWAMNPPYGTGGFRLAIATVTQAIGQYLEAMINTTQVFGVRLAVAILTTPIFIMIGVAALIDGLVERELRRYGGDNESAFVYHAVKPWMRPAVVGSWFLYLALPISIHPNMIFLPAAIMYGTALYLATSKFKKHL